MDQNLHLPIKPQDNTFTSHLSALDSLSTRLTTLTDQTRWPAQIPLNSKASFKGSIVHTNEVKVNVGGGWWIEMTAKEAVGYVNRRKMAMLEEKARGLEGSISSTASLQSLQSTSIGREPMRLPPVRTFNPLFQSPAKAGPSRRRETHHETAVPDSSESGRASSSTAPREAQHEMAAGTPSEVDPASSALARREARHEMAAGTPSEGEPGSSSLTRREAQHERAPPISSQGQPSSSSSSNVIPPIPGRDDTGDTLVDVIGDFVDKQRSLAAKPPSGEAVNGDELMLNEEGLPIHEIRETSDGSPIDPLPGATIPEPGPDVSPEHVEDDYWSEEAKARRAALRRRVFSEDTDSEEGEDSVELMTGTLAGTSIAAEPDQLEQDSPEPEPESSTGSSLNQRRPSATLPPPNKSILKPPTRKKSVSFDESVPLPPESPSSGTTSIGGTSFPLPSKNGEFEPRPVPLIAEPKPAVKSTVGERGFAGFKRGFLTTPAPAKSVPVQTPPLIAVTSPTSLEANANEVKPKKTSLFSQRKQQTESSSSPAANEKPAGLSKMSENKQMASLKSDVIEKAPPARVQPVTEPSSPTTGGEESVAEDDDDLEIQDDSESDEYSLDDALIAREVALEYHRRQAYSTLRQKGQAEEEEESGGVILALPQVGPADSKTGQPVIVNPTPDDLRKYVRVGKLENGNLVLAPGEDGWSDDDAEDEEVVGRRGRREEMKRRLLGLDVMEQEAEPNVAVKETTAEVLPPVVVSSVRERQPVPAQAEGTAPPKKVSRFKAARMGLS